MNDQPDETNVLDWGVLIGAVICATLIYCVILMGHALAWPLRAWRARRG